MFKISITYNLSSTSPPSGTSIVLQLGQSSTKVRRQLSDIAWIGMQAVTAQMFQLKLFIYKEGNIKLPCNIPVASIRSIYYIFVTSSWNKFQYSNI